MFQSDWLFRQIEMLGVAFERIVKALRNGDTESALELCDEAIVGTLELDPSLVHTLDASSLALLMGTGADGSRQAFVLSEILMARTEALHQSGMHEQASLERDKIRKLLEIARSDAEDDLADRIGDLQKWLDETDA